ncbi:MAG: winged helix-turn-helix domain-containing protein [Bacteroidota bacterium]
MEADLLSSDQPYAVGEWHVQPLLNSATRRSQAVSVEPRVMAVLTYLAQHAGQVVTRSDLLDAVWADVVVNEDALTRAVSELRKLFGDDPRAPRFVETVRGRGYRLIAPVTWASDTTPTPGESALSSLVAVTTMRAGSDSSNRRGWLAGLVAGAVLAGLAVGLWLGRDLLARAPTDVASWDTSVWEPAVPFTSYPGREIQPALSPEGARVAFAWDEAGGDNFDVYVKQVGSERPLRLTEHPSSEELPTWSPDGSTLAFARDGEARGIYTVPSMGGPVRLVHATAAEVKALDWAPDGQTLVFTTPAPETPGLQLLDLASGAVRTLTTPDDVLHRATTPRFSPGGTRIAFVRRGPGSGRPVFLTDVADGTVTPAPGDATAVRHLDWIDDETLVVVSYRSGANGLWRLDLQTGAMTWIATRGEWSFYPSVAAESGALVYQDLYFEKNIWQVRLDAPGGRLLSTEPLLTSTWMDCEAQFSPDGTRLAFMSSRSGFLEVWLSGVDGDDLVQVTQFEGAFVGNPRWSPDGMRLAFNAAPEGDAAVYVVDVRGGPPQALTPPGRGGRVTGWARDGTAVYAATRRGGDWGLWRVPVEGGTPEPVGAPSAFAGAESVDEQALYFTRAGIPGLWRVRLVGGRASGTPQRVFVNAPVDDALDWVVTPGGLYSLDERPEGTFVIYADLGAEAVTTIAEVTDIASPSLSVSPDGTTLLYGRYEDTRSDLQFRAAAD